VWIGCQRADSDSEVSATEDLMREHGVLTRLIVIYAGAAKRIEAGDRDVLGAIRGAARIAREFVENYHERIEEQYVFPRLEQAGELTSLVGTLRRQHDAGRGLTDHVLTLASGPVASAPEREALAAALRDYGALFLPHLGHEDTRVFPAFHRIAGADFRDLGELFEAEEQRQFGPAGFERVVAQLPALETAAGVGELELGNRARGPVSSRP
jgi:hemerythrin-like domain-containing protein